MSPNSLRVLAGAAAAVIVLLTGILVGFVGRAPECPLPTGPVQQTSPTPTATSAAPTANAGVDDTPGNGTLGNSVGARPDRSTPPDQPAAPNEAAPDNQAAPQPAPQAVTGPACEGDTFAIPAALTAVVGAGLASVVVLGLLLVAGARRPVPTSGPPAVGGPSRLPAGTDPRLDADRAALVRAAIYVRDRVTSRALADRLAAALRDAGVTVVEPVGDRFDPARHEAGGATPAADPSLTGTIAAVEVPGYIDRSGRVLRAPVVTVYQAGQGGGTTVSHPSGAHPTVTPRTTATQQPRRRTEEDR